MPKNAVKVFLLALISIFTVAFTQVASYKKQDQALAAGCGLDWCYTMSLKDASTKAIISGAIITINSRDNFSGCLIGDGGNWTFEYSSSNKDYASVCNLKSGESLPGTISITATKSGYDKKTTNISTAASATVYLEKTDTEAPTAPSNLKATNVSSTKATLSWSASTDNKGVSGYKIFRNGVQVATTGSTTYSDSSLKAETSYSYYVKSYDAKGNVSAASNTLKVKTALTTKDVGLPKIFTQKGAATTNLAKIKDLKKVKDFTIEVKGKNKIIWKELLDLSSASIANKFKSLDKYLKAEKEGTVKLDSENLKELNKKAQIEMAGLPYLEKPKILVDGEEDPSVVSNITYEKGIATFDITHFSKFEAVPTIELVEPTDNFDVQNPSITLKGKISDPTATVSASLNSTDLGEIPVASGSGEFVKNITLTEGDNTILVTAASSLGATLSAQLKGVYQPEKLNSFLIIGGASILVVLTIAVAVIYFIRKKKKPTLKITVTPNTPIQNPPTG